MLNKLETSEQFDDFAKSVFTIEEIKRLEKRITIIQLLIQGTSQREIAKRLKVGIASVSRGAAELKKGNFKFIKKDHESR